MKYRIILIVFIYILNGCNKHIVYYSSNQLAIYTYNGRALVINNNEVDNIYNYAFCKINCYFEIDTCFLTNFVKPENLIYLKDCRYKYSEVENNNVKSLKIMMSDDFRVFPKWYDVVINSDTVKLTPPLYYYHFDISKISKPRNMYNIIFFLREDSTPTYKVSLVFSEKRFRSNIIELDSSFDSYFIAVNSPFSNLINSNYNFNYTMGVYFKNSKIYNIDSSSTLPVEIKKVKLRRKERLKYSLLLRTLTDDEKFKVYYLND